MRTWKHRLCEVCRLAAIALIGGMTLAASAGSLVADEPAPAPGDRPVVIPVKPAGKAELIAAPAAAEVRSRITTWVAGRGVTDKAVLEQVGQLWSFGDEPRTATDLLEITVRTFGLVDGEAQKLIDACRLQHSSLLPPEAKVLAREDAHRFFLANMGLFYGRYLAHRQMYEEALEVLDRCGVQDVIDPATLLFFKAVCQHHLLMKKEGLKTIDDLLKNTESVPVRYTSVATLMQYDLEGLKEKTLDEVSRKMTDVERRLKLGRTGQKVQKREDEIVATLDELIKKIEEQSGGGGGGGDGSGKGGQSGSPANDSRVKGSTAPGKVDPKQLKGQGAWGSLPPKERAKAKDLIARDFPAHYRQAIEEYTRKQASRPGSRK